MTIYFSKPQNAGEAIRRVAKAAGGGNPVLFAELSGTSSKSDEKYVVRRYSNGVNMLSHDGTMVITNGANKVVMAKAHPNFLDRLIPEIRYKYKFLNGKIKCSNMLTDVYHNVIDRNWYDTTEFGKQTMLKFLRRFNNAMFSQFDLSDILKLIK